MASVKPASDVYSSTLDIGQFIQAASSTIGAIVMASKKGRVGERVYITDPKQFVQEFGEPDASISFGHYCALTFLTESNQLYVARAIGEGAIYGGQVLQQLDGNVYDSLTPYAMAIPSAFDPNSEINGSTSPFENLAYFYAIGPGSYAGTDVQIGVTSLNLKQVSGGAYNTPTVTKFRLLTNKDLSAPVPVVAVGITNVTPLTGTTAVAGVTPTAGDYVLLTAQTLPAENGYYLVPGVGAWVKQPDATYLINTANGAFWKKTGTNIWTVYVELNGVTPVITGDKTLFLGQTNTVDNGIYTYSTVTGVYTKQADDTQVIVTTGTYLYNRVGGTYIQDTTYTGSDLDAGTYEYKITSKNATGESISTVIDVTITDADTFVNLTWGAVENATSYQVYGRTAGVTFGYLGTVTEPSFTDLGILLPDTLIQPPTTYVGDSLFTVNVYDVKANPTVPVETFDVTFTDNVNGFGVQTELEARINNLSTGSNYIRVINAAKNNPSIPTIFGSLTTKVGLLGGSSGAAVTDSDVINAWDLFADKEQLTFNVAIGGGYTSPAILLAVDQLCKARRDAMPVFDVPSDQQKDSAAVNWRNNVLNLNSNQSALYSPDLLVQDNFNGIQLYVPPSGFAAATFALTDRDAAYWYAPAGLNRGLLSILGVRQVYNEGSRNLLQPAQINYIRKFPGLGYAIMEAYTLQSMSSPLSFIPIKRLAMAIDVAVSKALLFKLWDPNDDVLRQQITSLIEDFLEPIKRKRGLKDYFIVCDDSNNGPNTTNSGTLNCDVYILPLFPAARISLQLVITKEGVSFTEAVEAASQF